MKIIYNIKFSINYIQIIIIKGVFIFFSYIIKFYSNCHFILIFNNVINPILFEIKIFQYDNMLFLLIRIYFSYNNKKYNDFNSFNDSILFFFSIVLLLIRLYYNLVKILLIMYLLFFQDVAYIFFIIYFFFMCRTYYI
jgi:hypothetical protein